MERFTCDWIFNQLVILCDGTVVCGCADPHAERPIGNLATQNLRSIWNSPRVQSIREQLNRGFCDFCLPCGLKKTIHESESVPYRELHQDMPPRLFIEPTVLCNLSCYQSVCSRDSGILASRSRSRMPFDAFRSIIDEAGPGLVRIDLFNYGEPFAHPDAVAMIETIKSVHPGIYLYISTNGLLLDEAKIDRIVESRLDEITFSIDGASQRTYGRYRIGGDFRTAYENMHRMADHRDRTGREVPYINWRSILFRWNDSWMERTKMKRMALKAGVDRLTWEISDHPEDAVSRAFQTGSRAYRRRLTEIWDSSQISNAIASKRYLASIEPKTRAISVHSGQMFELAARVRNYGGARWWKQTPSGRRTVRLGAQLYNSSKYLIDRDFARAFLPEDMNLNACADITVHIPAISVAGDYWLKLDMVSEGIDWFESAGSNVSWIRLTVQ